MQAKDMFLKSENYLCYFFVFYFSHISFNLYSNTNDKIKALEYLSSLQYFSASFLQNDGSNLSEGKIYIGKNRVRAEYVLPSKILIILDQNKAMYFNYELEEDEFFNPKNTDAWYFYDIFRNPFFFKDSLVKVNNNQLILEKNGVDNEERDFIIRVYFEKNPMVLRNIELVINKNIINLSIFNHTFNEDFDRNFFKLINPKLLN